jgi:hypothetical protein
MGQPNVLKVHYSEMRANPAARTPAGTLRDRQSVGRLVQNQEVLDVRTEEAAPRLRSLSN